MSKNKGNKKETFQVELNKFQIMRLIEILGEQQGWGGLKVDGLTLQQHDGTIARILRDALCAVPDLTVKVST
jgi:hypothetical protein